MDSPEPARFDSLSGTLLTSQQLWKVSEDGQDRKFEYLTTLAKHTQAVNVVRFSPNKQSKNFPSRLWLTSQY